MFERIFDKMFRDDETLSPRVLVIAGLWAYLVLLVRPFLGFSYYLALPFVILALALVCFAAMRLLMPLMDPADPSADRLVVYGSAVLFVAIGIQAFGIWFLPGLVGGGAIVVWRAPELLESLPKPPFGGGG